MNREVPFFIIGGTGHNLDAENYLISSAKDKGLKLSVLSPENYSGQLPEEVSGGILYRVDIGATSRLMEYHLYRAGATTFREKGESFYACMHGKVSQYSAFLSGGVKTPKTIFAADLSTQNLKAITQILGLPLIVKLGQGTKGKGIFIVDSLMGLKTLVEYLSVRESHQGFVFQEYIECDGNYRVIVLGDEVIGVKKNLVKKDEFRANIGSEMQEQIITNPPHQLVDLAVRATKSLGVSFSGVDIIEKEGNYFVLEVNFPCDFSKVQQISGTNVSSMMIDFLIKKSTSSC